MTNEANPIKDQSFRIDKESYLLKNAEYFNSPNQDDRRDGQDPEIIVIHGISLPPGEYGGSYVSDLFLNSLDISVCEYFKDISTLKVSSHLFIDRLGRVTQFVPFNSRAWHAGESAYRGREMCNHFSIGIELEGQDNDEYSDIQYVKTEEEKQVYSYPIALSTKVNLSNLGIYYRAYEQYPQGKGLVIEPTLGFNYTSLQNH